jgi:Leucine-rich repeat (LRR) protein
MIAWFMVSRIVQAQVVELRGNGLTKLDNVFSACEQLEHLDVSHNLLTSLPPLHFSLGNVSTLVLAHNQLRSTDGLERLYSLAEVCCQI